MIKSMTGFGKSEVICTNEKFVIEIRTLNGKNCDISIKSSYIPREKEMEVRQYLSEKLIRGNIDIFINSDNIERSSAREINKDVFLKYYTDLNNLTSEINESNDGLIPAILRMPEVLDSSKKELDEENWKIMFQGIEEAVKKLDSFREQEGQSLYNEVKSRIINIESYIPEVEKYESERSNNVRERIFGKLKDLETSPDMNRLEQEMIYYLEKLDITEEKVRLTQHCQYFIETLDKEDNPGKKLGFITQEIGREINTLGSKANHAEMQKWVVRMKDELEKIKEQSLNIL